jgi:hypothetical protein
MIFLFFAGHGSIGFTIQRLLMGCYKTWRIIPRGVGGGSEETAIFSRPSQVLQIEDPQMDLLIVKAVI